MHVNRMRKIGPVIVESGEPEDGMFPDNLRLFKRIEVEGCELRVLAPMVFPRQRPSFPFSLLYPAISKAFF